MQGPISRSARAPRSARTQDLGSRSHLVEYLRTIRRIPRLSAPEELRLAKEFEAGQAAIARLEAGGLTRQERWVARGAQALGYFARHRLILSHMYLVVRRAHHFRHHGLSFLDLIQEGTHGLIRAVNKFDWRRGARFATYASWWISDAQQSAVDDHSRDVRLPTHIRSAISKIDNAQRELEQFLGRLPTIPELADALRLPPERVRALHNIDQPILSLYSSAGGATTLSWIDLVADPDVPDVIVERQLHSAELQAQVRELLRHLSGREAHIIQEHFGIGAGRTDRNLAEIGRELGLSRERVRQIEADALAKLRALAESSGLQSFLA